MRKLSFLLCCSALSLFAGVREDLAKMPDESVKIIYKSADFTPTLKVTDSKAVILGTVQSDSTTVNTYAKKEFKNGPTIYVNGSPFFTTAELRRIAKEAGVHIYCDSDKGVVYANNSMISFHTAMPGTYTLKAKSLVKWIMVYPKKKTYLDKQTEITFTVSQPDTVIFTIAP